MARAHYRETLALKGAANALTALPGATVTVRTTGTGTATPVALYAAAAGGAPLANPLTADANGVVEFWTDTDERLDLYIVAAGFGPLTVTVEVISQQTESGPEIVSPTLSGTLVGTPAWASGQTFPSVSAAVFYRNGGILSFGGIPAALQNLKYVPLVGANLALGNTDLYTVPTGRKALIPSIARVYNPSAGSITYFAQIKVGGTYYRANSSTTALATLTAGSSFLAQGIILNAGESVAINCATTAGLNLRGYVLEFDAADTRMMCARILALASGDNTLLTVPAGAGVLLATIGINLVNLGGAVMIVNDSGGSLNYYINVVPSGGAVGSTNQLYPATAIADKASTALNGGSALVAGDFINVNASGPGGLAWIVYYQIPV